MISYHKFTPICDERICSSISWVQFPSCLCCEVYVLEYVRLCDIMFMNYDLPVCFRFFSLHCRFCIVLHFSGKTTQPCINFVYVSKSNRIWNGNSASFVGCLKGSWSSGHRSFLATLFTLAISTWCSCLLILIFKGHSKCSSLLHVCHKLLHCPYVMKRCTHFLMSDWRILPFKLNKTRRHNYGETTFKSAIFWWKIHSWNW